MTSLTILVTGAGSGIGAGIAENLATQGHHLIVTDLNADAATQIAQAIRAAGGSAESHALDVTSDASVSAAWPEASAVVRSELSSASRWTVTSWPTTSA